MKQRIDHAREARQEGTAVKLFADGSDLGAFSCLMDGHDLQLGIDHPNFLSAGSEPLVDFFIDLSGAVARRKYLDSQIRCARPVTTSGQLVWYPRIGYEREVRSAHGIRIRRQLETGLGAKYFAEIVLANKSP